MKQNIYKNRNSHFFLLFCLIILLAISVRIAAFLISENSILGDMQPMDRILIVEQWLNSKNIIIPAWAFGPLHLSLLKALFRIFDNHLLIARLNSLFFGLGLLFVFYLFIKTEFKNKQIALLSLLFLALSPVHVLNSVISQAMSMFAFFIILSLIFFIKAIYNNKLVLKNLILSAIFLSLAGMIRFEGWLLIPILGVSIILNKKIKFRYVVLFVLICSIFPLYWIFLNYIATSEPIHFLQRVSGEFKYENRGPLSHRIFGWPKTLTKSLGLFIVIPSILGIIIGGKLRKHLFLVSLFIILFFIFEFATISSMYDYSIISRSSLLCLLIIPYAGWIVNFLWDKRKYYIQICIIIYLLIAVLSNLNLIIKYSFASRANLQAKQAIQFINKNCYSKRIILIDELNDGYTPYFIVKSKFPATQFIKLPFYFAKGKIKINDEEFRNLISQEKSEYIISSPYSLLAGSAVFKGLKLRGKIELIFSNSKYLVYKLNYEEDNIYNPGRI